jgi:hypothetical protein
MAPLGDREAWSMRGALSCGDGAAAMLLIDSLGRLTRFSDRLAWLFDCLGCLIALAVRSACLARPFTALPC